MEITGWGKNYSVEVHLSKILTQQCDYLINVPVLKYGIISGIILSMENNYGTIDRPDSCHDNDCDPYIPHINAPPHIRDKTLLIVLDALKGTYSRIGAPQWTNRQLFFGTDPVAVDYQGMMIIEEKRLSKERLGSIIKKAHHIQTAAKIGLGQTIPPRLLFTI